MKTIISIFITIIALILSAFRKGESTSKTEDKLNQDEELINTLKIQQDNAEYVHNLTDEQLDGQLHIFTRKTD